MNDFSNPASRISAVVEKMAQQLDRSSTALAWANVLGLNADNIATNPHEIQAKLRLLREELDLTDKLMGETSFSPTLYKPHIERIRRSISVGNLDAEWGNFKSNLRPETLLAIKFCSEILPSEPSINLEELQSVLDQAKALRAEIESLGLSQSVHGFLLRQLDILENGIRDYPIKGGTSIKRAFNEGFMDFASSAGSIEIEADKQEASKVANVWVSLKTAGKEFVEADRIASAYLNLIDKGSTAAQAVISLLSP